MKTQKRKVGDFGENIAKKFLMKRGFSIVERNYLRPWGEIDIVAQKGSEIHFIEVKTVEERNDVTHETIRPEENIHPNKLLRIQKTAQTYVMEHGLSLENVHIDAVIVRIIGNRSRARVLYLADIVL